MNDPRVDKLAQVLVNYCAEVQPNQTVALDGHLVTRPLMVATYREIIRAGGHPFVIWRDSEMQEIFIKEGSDDQLSHTPEAVKLLLATCASYISILGTDNTRSLNNTDPARQQLLSRSRMDLNKIIMEREAKGEFTFAIAMFPTPAYAQEADMSLTEYENFVYGACFVDQEDPVAEWHSVYRSQQALVDWLAGKKRVRVRGPHIDMTLAIDGRGFINSAGRKNMPSGEIFTSPIEDSAEGWVRFTYPAIYQGREVEGVELRFEKGKVVEAHAEKNEAFLLSVLDTDEGARYLGEFAIGTNNGIQQFTKSILFDEKIGGTIHMALGLGFPEVNGANVSTIHWDMICDMRDGGKIWVDDELFYDSGEFVIA